MGPHMNNENDWMTAELSTGTTILGCVFKDGVVVAADSRTSTGTYVSNRVTDKLTKVTDFVYCCRSGSAADTQAIADIVSNNMYLNENKTGKYVTVHEVAAEFRQYCYNYRDQLLAGIIIAGFDHDQGRGAVYSIPLGGMLQQENIAIGGSGSSYIYGFVKNEYRPDMERDECVDFARRAVWQAMIHDGSSGGVIRIAVITKNGVERRIYTADKENTVNLYNVKQTKV